MSRESTRRNSWRMSSQGRSDQTRRLEEQKWRACRRIFGLSHLELFPVYLIFTICLLSGECRDERIRLLTEITPMMCMLKAQEKLAEVVDPQSERVVRWGCARRKEIAANDS